LVDLITASVCLKRLKANGTSYSKSYFSQMVKDGKIPKHTKQGSPKNFFKYDEVKKAIEDSKDPTRDAQRDANDIKRVESSSLLDVTGTYPSQADMTNKEKADDAKILKELEDARQEAITAGAGGSEKVNSNMPENLTQATAKTEKEYWLGRKAELDFKNLNKELISVDEVNKQAFEMARAVRDIVLAIPARISPILAADNDQFSIQSKLTQEFNAALEVLSNE